MDEARIEKILQRSRALSLYKEAQETTTDPADLTKPTKHESNLADIRRLVGGGGGAILGYLAGKHLMGLKETPALLATTGVGGLGGYGVAEMLNIAGKAENVAKNKADLTTEELKKIREDIKKDDIKDPPKPPKPPGFFDVPSKFTSGEDIARTALAAGAAAGTTFASSRLIANKAGRNTLLRKLKWNKKVKGGTRKLGWLVSLLAGLIPIGHHFFSAGKEMEKKEDEEKMKAVKKFINLRK